MMNDLFDLFTVFFLLIGFPIFIATPIHNMYFFRKVREKLTSYGIGFENINPELNSGFALKWTKGKLEIREYLLKKKWLDLDEGKVKEYCQKITKRVLFLKWFFIVYLANLFFVLFFIL